MAFFFLFRIEIWNTEYLIKLINSEQKKFNGFFFQIYSFKFHFSWYSFPFSLFHTHTFVQNVVQTLAIKFSMLCTNKRTYIHCIQMTSWSYNWSDQARKSESEREREVERRKQKEYEYVAERKRFEMAKTKAKAKLPAITTKQFNNL